MKEYIDRKKLVKELECGIRAGNYEDGYENYTHINDVDDCVDTVKYFDKADVVEKEKILDFIEDNRPADIQTDWERGAAYICDEIEKIVKRG